MKLPDQTVRHEIAGRKNDGRETGRHIVRIVSSVTMHGFTVLNEKQRQQTQHQSRIEARVE